MEEVAFATVVTIEAGEEGRRIPIQKMSTRLIYSECFGIGGQFPRWYTVGAEWIVPSFYLYFY